MDAIPRLTRSLSSLLLAFTLVGCAHFPTATRSIPAPTKAGVDVVEAAIDAARELKFPPATKIEKQNGLVEFGNWGLPDTGIAAQVRRRGDGTIESTVRVGSVYVAKDPEGLADKFAKLIEEKISK